MKGKKYIFIVLFLFFIIVALALWPGRLEGYWHGSLSDCLCEDRHQNFIEFSDGNGYLRHAKTPRRTEPDVLYRRTGLYSYVLKVNAPT